jgi:hypothetical protein
MLDPDYLAARLSLIKPACTTPAMPPSGDPESGSATAAELEAPAAPAHLSTPA